MDASALLPARGTKGPPGEESGASPQSVQARAQEAVRLAITGLKEWEQTLQEREEALQRREASLGKELQKALAEVERLKKEAQVHVQVHSHSAVGGHSELLHNPTVAAHHASQFSSMPTPAPSANPRHGSVCCRAKQSGCEDIIGINMGGERKVSVKRSLLTQFEGSFLAAMFSGRWDEQVTRDPQGNVFFDDPPEVMMPLIEWLREVRDATPDHPAEPPCINPRYYKSWVRMIHRFGINTEAHSDFKITDGSHGGTAWFWYRSVDGNVVFKYRLKTTVGGEQEWSNFSRPATQDGAWWHSCDWTRGNTSHEVSVWVDGECRWVWDGLLA